MNFVLDTHCHTLASGHAYSTIQEMAAHAATIGFELIAITDHGPKMPGSTHSLYFKNLRVIPRKINGVEILRGVEVNILDHRGKLDIPEGVLEELDIVIASFHHPCIKPGSVEENTNTLINLIKKPYINIIGHPGNPSYPVNIEKVVEAAKEYRTLIEINNSSLKPDSFRTGSKENCYKILEACKKKQVPVAIGSDAHIAFDIGHFPFAKEMLERLQMPEELVVNTSVDRLKAYIK
ncbi:phosphatase [Clostridium formicaceticum]|jgi:putative hydrolase|uniref:Phosphatase n=1 Tax=Clostridium formicaceticum TaxID=1497 RepID=A0AAC9RJ71_9CLOT|nr:phosphatase [Clostridium formicaceticum]AOY75782.1 phosphatase [Clostridium formicaceticum]ARE86108.1 putative phosphatase YcdX [Clostridium formicaceticum]